MIDTTTAIVVGCLIGAVFLIIIGSCLMQYCQSNNNVERIRSKSTNTSYSKVSQNGNNSYASYDMEINTDSEANMTDIEEGMLERNAKYVTSQTASSHEEIVPMIETDDIIDDNHNQNGTEIEKEIEISSDIQPNNAYTTSHTDHAQANGHNDTIIEMTAQEMSMPNISPSDQTQDKRPLSIETQENGADGANGAKDGVTVTNNDIHEKHDASSDVQHGPECHENVTAAIASLASSGSLFGESQSPINIITNKTCENGDSKKYKVMADDEFISNPLRFNYPECVKNCTIMNNGHTVQINIAEENECTLRINGKLYSLKQFHFHTPSEHLIDGTTFEMEMHLVHVNKQGEIAVLGFIFTTKQQRYKPSLKLSKSRMHLILDTDNNNTKDISSKKLMGSKMIIPMESMQEDENEIDGMNDEDEEEESDDLGTDSEWESDGDGDGKPNDERKMDGDEGPGNDFLAQFWDQLPSTKTQKDILLKKPLSFDYLFETSSSNFKKNVETNAIDIDMELFEYMGSLTTPPYTEGVQWLVSKKTHFINERQLKRLSGCEGCCNNARPVQDYFGRTVSLRSKSSLKVIS